MEIRKDIKNDLMQRREVQVIVDSDKTPSFADASKLFSEQFKSPEENIMVERVGGKFGRNTFLLQASIYASPELKEAAYKRLTKMKKTAAAAPAA
jgi:ribosomal protein S24E